MRPLTFFQSALQSAISLFYPHRCAGCGNELASASQSVCLKCISRLPETNFAMRENNPVEKIFWGRINIQAATSQYYFSRSSTIQSIIHQLKYKGNQDVGLLMGRMLGNAIKQSGRFSNIDGIIPLPLFPEKEWSRGYNQAEVISRGIQEILNVPVIKDAVIRKKFTVTQTHKTRMERWQNVNDVFHVVKPQLVEKRRLLLTDDVITTGATLEACGTEILRIQNTELYISALAYAMQ